MDVMIDNNNPLHRRTLGQDLRRVALVMAAILLVPFVAMRFTNEVNWTIVDFIVAAILLGGTGLAFILLARRTRQAKWRIAIGAVLLAALLLVWAELGVGLVGTPFAGN